MKQIIKFLKQLLKNDDNCSIIQLENNFREEVSKMGDFKDYEGINFDIPESLNKIVTDKEFEEDMKFKNDDISLDFVFSDENISRVDEMIQKYEK